MRPTILLIVLLAVACKVKPTPERLPRPVYDSCTNKWALLTGLDGGPKYFGLYYQLYWLGDDTSGLSKLPQDTVETADPGNELVFKDSIEAWGRYRAWPRNAIAKATAAQQRDSIIRCQHTYN